MGKGYAEGPAAEAAEEARERGYQPVQRRPTLRRAVFGSTPDTASAHFIGWADEVDAAALFRSGGAWGLSERLIQAG